MNTEDQDKSAFESLLKSERFTDAFNFVKSIADKEVPWAQYEVGNMYLLGQGVEKNDVMGLFYIGEAADYGNYAPAQYVVGKFYLHGIGLSQDIKRTAWYIGKASAANYKDSRVFFKKTLELINQNRDDGKEFLNNWILNSNNKNSITWTNLAKNCGLSKNCIKGLAFLLGCTSHFAGKNAQESQDILNWFMTLPSPDDMTKHFNHVECDQAVHYIFEEFAYKIGFEFDPERLNIDGKKATLFKPQDYELLKDIPDLENYHNKVKEAHIFFEDMLEKIGGCLYEDENHFTQTAYLQSCSYMSSAFQNDANALSSIIKTILDLSPPVFYGLLSLKNTEMTLASESEGGTTPFQLAYRPLLDSKKLQMCELLWNCQRHAFYNQKTHELINKDKVFLNSDSFLEFSIQNAKQMIASGYFANTSAKTLIDNSYLLPESNIALEEFIKQKCSKFSNSDTHSLSTQLQLNAIIFREAFSILIKNIAWDNSELGNIRCMESTGTIWECDEVNDLMEFAFNHVPMISSWSTGNQIIIFTKNKSTAKFFVTDVSENMTEFNQLVITDIELNNPLELIFFFSNDVDFFENPELAPANAMKAIFTHFKPGLEPEMKIVICNERTDKRLKYDFEFETVPLSRTHFENEINSHPIIQSYLKLT